MLVAMLCGVANLAARMGKMCGGVGRGNVPMGGQCGGGERVRKVAGPGGVCGRGKKVVRACGFEVGSVWRGDFFSKVDASHARVGSRHVRGRQAMCGLVRGLASHARGGDLFKKLVCGCARFA